MDYAAVLYFDPESEQKLQSLMQALCDRGINRYMIDMGMRPHITLAFFKQLSMNNLEKELRQFAGGRRKFTLRLGSLGLFPTDPGVVYLSPVFTDELGEIHQAFYHCFEGTLGEYVPYYLPGSWVPHCTLANRLTREEAVRSVEYLLETFYPMEVQASEVCFVACDPVQELFCMELG